MTARERVLTKSSNVRIVLKAYMTKQALDDDEPNWDRYAERALDWWDAQRSVMRGMAPELSEDTLALHIVKRMRKHDVWGRILALGGPLMTAVLATVLLSGCAGKHPLLDRLHAPVVIHVHCDCNGSQRDLERGQR